MKEIKTQIAEVENKIETLSLEIDRLQNELDTFDKTEHYCEDDYKNILNDETVDIAGITMNVGDVLLEMDHCAFYEGYINFVDSMDYNEFSDYEELEEEMEELNEQLEELNEQLEELEEEE